MLPLLQFVLLLYQWSIAITITAILITLIINTNNARNQQVITMSFLFFNFTNLLLLNWSFRFLIHTFLPCDRILHFGWSILLIDSSFSLGTYKALRYVPTYHQTKLAGSWISRATATQRYCFPLLFVRII